jgi:hypothetical protein
MNSPSRLGHERAAFRVAGNHIQPQRAAGFERQVAPSPMAAGVV